METTFSWNRIAQEFTPVSSSNLLNQDGICLLDCVLMDCGGVSYLESIAWLNEGMDRISSVAAGSVRSSNWRRETWGVEFMNNKARIYSLHDETYFQAVSLDAFSKVLQEWIAFLQSQPDARNSKVFDLSVD